jgi:hypothetical protein
MPLFVFQIRVITFTHEPRHLLSFGPSRVTQNLLISGLMQIRITQLKVITYVVMTLCRSASLEMVAGRG